MKSIFAVLILVASSALACGPEEAQFVGKVRQYDQSACTYQIDFSTYNNSTLCPLARDQAAYWTFSDATCSMKDGDSVYGYLVKEGSSIRITD